MPEDRNRQLAAIMFADMVGYTALMQDDEDGARVQRDRQRVVLSTLVPKHNGEILQHYGDGTLSIFSSAVEAVKCAVAFQLELRKPPAVNMRVGLHTGDVVQDANGVYGHGVNVASRIEALAAPGGIMISGKVYDEIKNHPTLSAVPFGPVQLKNVEYPVNVFGISNDDLPLPSVPELRRGALSGLGTGPFPGGDGVGKGEGEPSGVGEAFMSRVLRRAVIQWALVYLLGAWIVLQAGSFGVEQLHWPSHLENGLGVLAFVGFLVTLVVAWHHGERGRQPVRPREVVLLSVLLGLGVGSLFLVHTEGEPGTDVLPALPVSEAGDRPSIAVLPFDNFSPDPDDAYFPNGVQEDITTALSRIRALRVPARSSVSRFRDDRPSSQEMAAALGVDYLLEGSTTVIGGTVRVTVQLIHGGTDAHIWAENYDHEFSLEQVISVRTAVAQAVASKLSAIITPQEESLLAVRPTENAEALRLYQRARFGWSERSSEGVRESLDLFQEAIDLDSTFAEAYAGLADALLVMANRGWMDHREGHPRGIAAAERALELDPTNASANASLGALHLWSTRDWVASEAYFRTAIRLDPEYAYSHHWYSALLSALGRHEEAVRQSREAWELDPLSSQIASGLPRSLFLAREYRQARDAVDSALVVFPADGALHAQLCRIDLIMGEVQAAEDACRQEREILESGASLSTALTLALQGDEDGALREVGRLYPEGAEDGPQPIFMAMIYASLGDADAAFTQLRKALDEDYPYVEYLPSNPFLDPLRNDLRFEVLLARIGL